MKRLTEEIVTKAEASNARWDPLDLSVIDQIRRFEAEQPSATEEIVRRPSEALRLTQALLFNGTERATAKGTPAKSHETPLLFCLYTVADDLRLAEMNLALGYVVGVAWALRDAVEAIALSALFWRDPKRSETYWGGAEFKPSQVRQDLEALQIWPGALASLWVSYNVLSKLAHPNVARLALVTDEWRTDAGVWHGLRAGGTREEKKLWTFNSFAAQVCVDVTMMAEPIINSYLSTDDQRIFEACVRDVMRKSGEVLELSLARRHQQPEAECGTDKTYEQRLRKSFGKPMEMLQDALSELEVSRKQGRQD